MSIQTLNYSRSVEDSVVNYSIALPVGFSKKHLVVQKNAWNIVTITGVRNTRVKSTGEKRSHNVKFVMKLPFDYLANTIICNIDQNTLNLSYEVAEPKVENIEILD